MGTVYEDLSADQTEAGTSEIESLCMNCQKNVSWIMLTLLYSSRTDVMLSQSQVGDRRIVIYSSLGVERFSALFLLITDFM